MKEFKLETDINTIQFKTIIFLGILLFGFSIWSIFNGVTTGDLAWINSFTGLIIGAALVFVFSFGNLRKQSLVIDEKGFHANNYKLNLGGKEKIEWGKISTISLNRNKIVVKNSIGSTERMSLPMLHTKQQVLKLKEYLKEIAETRDIEFKEA